MAQAQGEKATFGWLFHFRDSSLTKTSIYIDGYNLYYSRLKGTQFKWLDVVALFRDCIVQQQCLQADIVAVNFFTAPIKASYARHGQSSEHAQTQYHRALLAKYPDLVHIVKGFHIFQHTMLPAYQAGKVSNKRLTPLAHWVRHHFQDQELAKSQMPHHVQTLKKPASKPLHW